MSNTIKTLETAKLTLFLNFLESDKVVENAGFCSVVGCVCQHGCVGQRVWRALGLSKFKSDKSRSNSKYDSDQEKNKRKLKLRGALFTTGRTMECWY